MMMRTTCLALLVLSASLLWLGCNDSRSCEVDDDCFSGEVCIDQICAPDQDNGGSDGGADVSEDATTEDTSTDDGATDDASDSSTDDTGEDNDTTSTEPKVIKVETGKRITCALFDNGEVFCWGKNENGLLNIDSTIDRTPYPTVVEGIPAAADLELGNDFACILTEAGQVQCWGENKGFVSEKGDSDIIAPTPAPVDGIVMLRTGSSGGCGLLEDRRRMYCWGQAPAAPDFSQDIVDFQVGSYHTCAVVADGNVRCWGTTSSQVGEDDPVHGISDVTALDSSGRYNCAVKSNGEVWCWGENFDGQLGIDPDSQGSSRTPLEVPNITNAIGISTGNQWACAILDGGGVKCWGKFSESDGAYEEFHPPMNISPLFSGVVDVDTGDETTCALEDDGEVWCWGQNTYEQLGNSELSTAKKGEPARVLFE
ncbi:MAG: RCC1 domain-containing protein [Myxococcota bacterium]